jgi:hypothetical protein
MQTDITRLSEVTPYQGGWCGNDVFTGGDGKGTQGRTEMAQKLGNQLYNAGYKGAFCWTS